jgi:hypothetical protein
MKDLSKFTPSQLGNGRGKTSTRYRTSTTGHRNRAASEHR